MRGGLLSLSLRLKERERLLLGDLLAKGRYDSPAPILVTSGSSLSSYLSQVLVSTSVYLVSCANLMMRACGMSDPSDAEA